MYYRHTFGFGTDDGTSQALTPDFGSGNELDLFYVAVDFGTGSTKDVGFRNITDTGSFVWNTPASNYDGAYVSDNVFTLSRNGIIPILISDIHIYKTRQGKTFVETNY